MTSDDYKRFEFHFGVILLRTRRFQGTMDRLGKARIAKPLGWFLLFVMPVAAAIGFYIFLTQLSVLLSPTGIVVAGYIRTISPLANLGIPGINPYIPVVDGWIALVVAMIIHEGAHGVLARSLGLPVKSAGLLFFLFVPIGAFVDVDEGALKDARASYSGRVLAGGAGINLVVGLVSLLLLVSLVSGMAPLATGAGILNVGDGTPAAAAGVIPGDIIVSINGQNITDLNTVLGPNTTLHAGEFINLTVYRNGHLLPINHVGLACCNQIINTKTNTTISYPYIGVSQATGSDLTTALKRYTSPLANPFVYVCIPTFARCQPIVPFSDSLAGFYSSPLGGYGVPAMNLLYWLFFINFNLAIFNALPIYPLDGGQAFLVGVKALGRGRISDLWAMRITTGTTVAVAAMILGVILVPWFL